MDRHSPALATFTFVALMAGAPLVLAAEVPAAADPEIARLVRDVSQSRLETTIRTLAGFGTRHSLSATDDPKRGIGAARRWIKARLDACAAEAGARLKVEFDEFVQEPSARVPKAVPMVNVVATLEGVDPVAKPSTVCSPAAFRSPISVAMRFATKRAMSSWSSTTTVRMRSVAAPR